MQEEKSALQILTVGLILEFKRYICFDGELTRGVLGATYLSILVGDDEKCFTDLGRCILVLESLVL